MGQPALPMNQFVFIFKRIIYNIFSIKASSLNFILSLKFSYRNVRLDVNFDRFPVKIPCEPAA
ncbi:hypothetical protein EFZ10_13545 [Tatumella sp. TA1]|nr:hypothetical protein EFZ10_13545 [Tatumella sp. TA1]